MAYVCDEDLTSFYLSSGVHALPEDDGRLSPSVPQLPQEAVTEKEALRWVESIASQVQQFCPGFAPDERTELCAKELVDMLQSLPGDRWKTVLAPLFK